MCILPYLEVCTRIHSLRFAQNLAAVNRFELFINLLPSSTSSIRTDADTDFFWYSISQSLTMELLDKTGPVVPAITNAHVEDPKENASLKESKVKSDLENANQQDLSREIEDVLRRKLDWHVIPLVSALCSFVAISALGKTMGLVLNAYYRSSCFS